VRDTQRIRDFAALAAAFSDLTAHLNQPRLHNRVLEKAGVSVDVALGRLLLGLHRHGPVGVTEIAERAGRDHTTISRQIARMVEQGLVERRPSEEDARVSHVVVSAKGARMADALRQAHMELVLPALDDWPDRDVKEITCLMRKLADDVAKLG
jgi:DNA-binding MarR family transcriptional regulator